MGKWKSLYADSNSPYRGMTREEMVAVKVKKRMDLVDAYPARRSAQLMWSAK